MALGVACAGTGNKEALSLLEPMLTDATPFVQQVYGQKSGLSILGQCSTQAKFQGMTVGAYFGWRLWPHQSLWNLPIPTSKGILY